MVSDEEFKQTLQDIKDILTGEKKYPEDFEEKPRENPKVKELQDKINELNTQLATELNTPQKDTQ